MENAYYKAHKQLMQLRKEQEAARAKATAGTEARAQAEPPSEDDATPMPNRWKSVSTGSTRRPAPEPRSPGRPSNSQP